MKNFSDEHSKLSFDDFLDLLSVLHPKTSKTLKLYHLFTIYDFNNDGFLCTDDLTKVINRISGKKLKESGMSCHRIFTSIAEFSDVTDAAERVVHELDLDKTGKISLEEFEFFTNKCPDFAILFSSTQSTS